jgi:hypothetical protein
MLTGLIPDEAALYGIVLHLRDLRLQSISLSSEDIQEEQYGGDT